MLYPHGIGGHNENKKNQRWFLHAQFRENCKQISTYIGDTKRNIVPVHHWLYLSGGTHKAYCSGFSKSPHIHHTSSLSLLWTALDPLTPLYPKASYSALAIYNETNHKPTYHMHLSFCLLEQMQKKCKWGGAWMLTSTKQFFTTGFLSIPPKER